MTELVTSGPLLVALAVSLAAGFVSFASPCSLPLVPGYLGYLASVVGAGDAAVDELRRPRSDRLRVAGAALLFVAGFSVVFAGAAVVALGLSDMLIRNELVLQRVGGIITIAMGLVFVGLVPALQRDTRAHHLPAVSLAGAPMLGAVYGLGWTPCLGPTLTGVIAVASGTEVGSTTLRGLVLVLAYCLGLGLPFVILALGANWAVNATGWLRRHIRAVQIFGGVLLLVMGTLLVTGLWADLIIELRRPISSFTTPI